MKTALAEGSGEVQKFGIYSKYDQISFSSQQRSSLKKDQMQGAGERPRRRSETYVAQGSEDRNAADDFFQRTSATWFFLW